MRIGIITGSGTEGWPLDGTPARRVVTTRYGQVQVTEGMAGNVEVVHVARHEPGHRRLSHQVNHRANIAALLEAGVAALVSFTVCGGVDKRAEPGSLVIFDDLYFPSNRLPDGTACTWFDEPGERGRGHWIFDLPFSEPLRRVLIAAAPGGTMLDRGTYGHVEGPRFNSRSEVAALAAAGVTAVSQTAGPEVVLAGEAELPMALAGYVTDYANGVAPPEPAEALATRLKDSSRVFAGLAARALAALDELPTAAGFVYRLGS